MSHIVLICTIIFELINDDDNDDDDGVLWLLWCVLIGMRVFWCQLDTALLYSWWVLIMLNCLLLC